MDDQNTPNYEAPKLLYHGRPMAFAPINVSVLHLIQTLHKGTPQVVVLEPGDATRYMLLLLPLDLGDEVSSYLGDLGIPAAEADRYLFVSKLSHDVCLGTWVPFGPDVHVGTYDVTDLTPNEWSRELLAWWLTHLYRLLY